MRRDEETGLLLIDRPEDMPDFESDEQEIVFWETHALSEKFWKRAKHVAPDERSEPHSRRGRAWLSVLLVGGAPAAVFLVSKGSQAARR